MGHVHHHRVLIWRWKTMLHFISWASISVLFARNFQESLLERHKHTKHFDAESFVKEFPVKLSPQWTNVCSRLPFLNCWKFSIVFLNALFLRTHSSDHGFVLPFFFLTRFRGSTSCAEKLSNYLNSAFAHKNLLIHAWYAYVCADAGIEADTVVEFVCLVFIKLSTFLPKIRANLLALVLWVSHSFAFPLTALSVIPTIAFLPL